MYLSLLRYLSAFWLKLELSSIFFYSRKQFFFHRILKKFDFEFEVFPSPNPAVTPFLHNSIPLQNSVSDNNIRFLGASTLVMISRYSFSSVHKFVVHPLIHLQTLQLEQRDVCLSSLSTHNSQYFLLLSHIQPHCPILENGEDL